MDLGNGEADSRASLDCISSMSRHTDWSASVRARRGPRDQRVWVRAWQLVCARVRGGRAGEASASLAEGRRPRRACARAARAWARRLTGGRAVSGFHVAPPWTPAVKIPRERATPSSWRGEARAGAVVPPPCVSHRRASDAARQHCCTAALPPCAPLARSRRIPCPQGKRAGQ